MTGKDTMLLKARHTSGWLDIGSQEKIESEVINFRRCLLPGQVVEVPDEYRSFRNIDSAIKCRLLEVVNYDNSPGSLVVNDELIRILYESSSSSSLASSSSSSYFKRDGFRAYGFSVESANGCYVITGEIDNGYPVYSNGVYLLRHGDESFPRWCFQNIETLLIHYVSEANTTPTNNNQYYTPYPLFLFLGAGGKVAGTCFEEESSLSSLSSISSSSSSSLSSLSSSSTSFCCNVFYGSGDEVQNSHFSSWELNGVRNNNSDFCTLHVVVLWSAVLQLQIIRFYKDAEHSQLVAEASEPEGPAIMSISQRNGSGINGTVVWDGVHINGTDIILSCEPQEFSSSSSASTQSTLISSSSSSVSSSSSTSSVNSSSSSLSSANSSSSSLSSVNSSSSQSLNYVVDAGEYIEDNGVPVIDTQ